MLLNRRHIRVRFVKKYRRSVLLSFQWKRLLPRDASAERGNATVSRLSVCNV